MSESVTQLHDLIATATARTPQACALAHSADQWTYSELLADCRHFANGVLGHDFMAGDRIGVYLPKQYEAVVAIFGASAAGGTFVPINPLLRPQQVAYIANDCGVKILVTSASRWRELAESDASMDQLAVVVLVDGNAEGSGASPSVITWASLQSTSVHQPHERDSGALAAILYTSGSTGKPKGVMVSHRNLIVGALSVSSYLSNSENDRLLALLPLSFDAGLSQLTTAFHAGATAVLFDYLLPQDTLRAIDRHAITGLLAVPALWNQLVQLDWPDGCGGSLRYIANTGGALPVASIKTLRSRLPNTDIYLMYGLTEAFRSTYLPPKEVDRIPDSIGKAIPGATIMVVDDQGRECAPGEVGELVHRGELVALGYWNNPEATAERFRTAPGEDKAAAQPEIAVWSGDQVVKDADGFLYFVGRNDDMIKTSGYRVSPTEVEELAYTLPFVAGAVAIGVPHAIVGTAILLIVTASQDSPGLAEALGQLYRRELPRFMQPQQVVLTDALPLNQNGKFDRVALREDYKNYFDKDGSID